MAGYIFDIEHVKQLGGSRFMGYAMQAQAAMVKEGQASDRHLNLHWENEGVFAILREIEELKHGGDSAPMIIGMITFTEQKWANCLSIGLAFVPPRFRNNGVYGSLWMRLVELAQDRGVSTIDSTTFAKNSVMREVAKKQGRVEKGIVLEFEVPAKQQTT